MGITSRLVALKYRTLLRFEETRWTAPDGVTLGHQKSFPEGQCATKNKRTIKVDPEKADFRVCHVSG